MTFFFQIGLYLSQFDTFIPSWNSILSIRPLFTCWARYCALFSFIDCRLEFFVTGMLGVAQCVLLVGYRLVYLFRPVALCEVPCVVRMCSILPCARFCAMRIHSLLVE